MTTTTPTGTQAASVVTMAAAATAKTTAIRSAIDLNNQAAILIQNGYYSMSTKVLRSALALTAGGEESEESSQVVETAHDCDNDMIRQSSHATPTMSSKANRSPSSIQEKTPGGESSPSSNVCPATRQLMKRRRSSLTQKSIDDGSDFVYRRPIHIPSSGIILVESDRANLEELSIDSNADDQEAETEDGCVKHRVTESDVDCIILFNMALSFHLAALDSSAISSEPKKQAKMFKKALRLYEMSFMMQVDLGVLTLSDTLGVVNNCSTIYTRLDRVDRAERFYQHMLSTIMTMIESGDPVKSQVKDLDGFLHNICSSGLFLKNIAAPAA